MQSLCFYIYIMWWQLSQWCLNTYIYKHQFEWKCAKMDIHAYSGSLAYKNIPTSKRTSFTQTSSRLASPAHIHAHILRHTSFIHKHAFILFNLFTGYVWSWDIFQYSASTHHIQCWLQPQEGEYMCELFT